MRVRQDVRKVLPVRNNGSELRPNAHAPHDNCIVRSVKSNANGYKREGNTGETGIRWNTGTGEMFKIAFRECEG